MASKQIDKKARSDAYRYGIKDRLTKAGAHTIAVHK